MEYNQMRQLARLPRDSEHLNYRLNNYQDLSTARAGLSRGFDEDRLG
jgi:hypothetical protein